jgi:DhnA family fructose-bisphosphate aldolase class Ia
MTSIAESGKLRRLARIFDVSTRRCVVVPLDDSLLSGPEGGLRDMGRMAAVIREGEANAVLGFRGLFTRYGETLRVQGRIVNLTASTIRSAHTRKVLVGTVEDALRLDADAVAVHVNISSRYETEMLRNLGEVAATADRAGMPVMAIMYPRTEANEEDDNYVALFERDRSQYSELVRHAARVGCELGADMIKTQFTGDSESFHTVVEACQGVPVLIAGGPVKSPGLVLEDAHAAIAAGAAGVSFGRNVFMRREPRAFIEALRSIVIFGRTVDDAMVNFGGRC